MGNTAFDYAANTRGYSNGVVLGYISPGWSLKYGFYLMPAHANGQQLEYAAERAHAQNIELRLSPWPEGPIVRLLAYLNTARRSGSRNPGIVC